jgi:hypothetical protein
MISKETNSVLEKLRARAEGAIQDRASEIKKAMPPPPAALPVVVTQARQEFKPKPVEASIAPATQQGDLFPRSKRSNDGIVTRFTDDEIREKRQDIASAAMDLNLNITMSDHNRICHNYFKRAGGKITPEMVREVWASDRRRHKRHPDRMS